LGFIVSCNLTFIYVIDFITAIVFKPILYLISVQFNSMALCWCAIKKLLTHSLADRVT